MPHATLDKRVSHAQRRLIIVLVNLGVDIEDGRGRRVDAVRDGGGIAIATSREGHGGVCVLVCRLMVRREMIRTAESIVGARQRKSLDTDRCVEYFSANGELVWC